MTDRKALLIIDVQERHIAEAAGGPELVATLTDLRDRALEGGIPVFLVQHRGIGFDEGEPGWELAIHPTGVETVVHKSSADSFIDTDLDDHLRAARVTTLVITGYSTEYCVDSTTRAALARGYEVILPEDGHATARQNDVITPTQVVAHHNSVLESITYADRRCVVIPADEVTF